MRSCVTYFFLKEYMYPVVSVYCKYIMCCIFFGRDPLKIAYPGKVPLRIPRTRHIQEHTSPHSIDICLPIRG